MNQKGVFSLLQKWLFFILFQQEEMKVLSRYIHQSAVFFCLFILCGGKFLSFFQSIKMMK